MLKPEYIEETYRKLGGEGLLLVSRSKAKRRPNAMTIGWAFLGRFWDEPFFVVAVRKSRYTHRCIEETGDFTVNVPGRGMEGALRFCGSHSGRDHDKFKEAGIRSGKAKKVSSPVVLGSSIVYECRVAYKANIAPKSLPKSVLNGIYPDRDFHTLYFGEVVACYRGPRA
ncbi:MAG: flavin reductase family protein [Candidatus Brockarchaeota archaeon]|nr:flavin reductase family protein [Candidatus Brockarchaeota archaeon]